MVMRLPSLEGVRPPPGGDRLVLGGDGSGAAMLVDPPAMEGSAHDGVVHMKGVKGHPPASQERAIHQRGSDHARVFFMGRSIKVVLMMWSCA